MSSRYHRSQKLVGLARYTQLLENRDLGEQINFHRVALNRVRWALGSSCKHLTHVKDNDGIYVKAILNTNSGERTVNVDTGCVVASELRADHYKQVKDVLDGVLRG